MKLRIVRQIVIGVVLLFGHVLLNPHTILLRNPRIMGVEPITNNPLPLTADDIARGVKANPNIQVDQVTLSKAAKLRTEYAQLKSEHGSIIVTLNQHSADILGLMETP